MEIGPREPKNSVFVRSCFSLPLIGTGPLTPIQSKSTISSLELNEADVYESLSSLDPTKAIGPDNISPCILRACAVPLNEPLCHLFSISLSKAVMPYEWKIHLISPIFKSGDKSLASNYRPISLLCSISKVLESIILKKIIDFIRPQLSPRQFGFLSNRSCLHKLLISLSNIISSLDNGFYTDVIYLDLKKAFDSACHNELLVKLWSFGICDSLWQWFKCYLSDRVHAVRFDHHSSSFLPVISGVPQGSVLGPILFLIYINDMDSYISHATMSLFADDSQFLKQIRSEADCLLLHDLDSLDTWSNHWHISFNAKKCVHLRFGRNSASPVCPIYTICCSNIVTLESHNDLGVTLTNSLSWSPHIKNILSKAYRTLGMIKRAISSHSSVQIKLPLYISLVRSHLLYCSSIWRPNLVKDSSALEHLQRRASKYILNYPTDMDYKMRLLNLKLLPITLFLEVQDILLFVKLIFDPPDNFSISDYIIFLDSSSRSSSQGKIRSALPLPKSSLSNHFYFNRIVRIWNSLPLIDLDSPFSSIKKQIYSIYWDYFITSYSLDNSCSWYRVCLCSFHST